MAAWCRSRTTRDSRQSSSTRTTMTQPWGQRTTQALRPPLGFRPHPFLVGKHGTVTGPVGDRCDRGCEVPRRASSSQTPMRMMVSMVWKTVFNKSLRCKYSVHFTTPPPNPQNSFFKQWHYLCFRREHWISQYLLRISLY
jgi:hypothetical protein